ncbi:hypothetical protein IHO40_01290 [Wolbachia endosymbiont of Mansonella ozzardi]|uniref:hypothetical protein n=1 Tax=Wolbachia endosymbiont of Mansonella ozzardi TaxID=137464 RepID=UPI001CE0E576|nr:hypothetical protein [Wolbachia endosymbiont of Mansonella ozzardi]MCA4774804.1 hypothetical protein [Wolbachia endosymbiont of Mansonella ozzardi]
MRENAELENNLRKKSEDLEDGKEKQLEKQLMEAKKENEILTKKVSQIIQGIE